MTRAALVARVIVACVGITVLTGCGLRATQSEAPPPAQVLASVPRCDANPMPEPGTVPTGFVPVAVILCDVRVVLRAPGGADTSSTLAATPPPHQTLTGDLGPLLAALARPSDPVPAGAACPAMAQIPPLIFLVDAGGRAVRPAWPRDACGFVQRGAHDALQTLAEG